MKRALLIAPLALAGFALTPPVAAAPLDAGAVTDRVLGAPAPQPGEDGLVLFEGHYYRFADGLLSHRHQRLLRATTEWALERLADPRLRFDSARQKIEVHAARTYFADGEYIDAPDNAFNTVTPGDLDQAPDFLDIQELVVTQVGLEPGCFLWLDVETVDHAPAGLPEGALLFPQGDFPVLEMEVIAEGLYAELVNPEGGLLALRAGAGAAERMRWHFANLPAAPGQARHRLGDQLPHLNLSSLPGWEQVVLALDRSLEAAVTDTSGLAAWLDAVERELGRPFLDDRDALDAWLGALQARTRLLDGDDWAWRAPRSVARILETSLATPLERAALIAAAARSRDLTASLLLPRRWQLQGGRLLPLAALAAPLLETEAGVLAPAEGRLLAPGETLAIDAFALRPGSAPLLQPGETRRLQYASNQHWDLAEGDFALSASFAGAGLWPAVEQPESGLRDWVAGWTDSSRVVELSLHAAGPDRFAVELSGKAALPAADAGGRLRVALPMPPFALSALLPPGMPRAQRDCRALLFPPCPVALHIAWILDLPAGFDALPAGPSGADCPGARFVARREQEGRRLTVHYDLEWAGLPVPPADYPAFRALVNAALDPRSTELLLVPRAGD